MKSSHIVGYRAFTLLELIVVITIMSIVMFASYLPYAHHQKKTLLKQAAREVSQSLSDARNLALHGLDTGSGNLNIGLYFASGATQITYYAYPLTRSLTLPNLDPLFILKTKRLPKGVQIDSGGGAGEFLITFDAITGSGSLGASTFPIRLSYLGSSDLVLQREVLYYPKSYISDY